MGKKAKPQYEGILSEPLSLPVAGLLADEDELNREYAEEYLKRVKALYQHYGVKLGQPGADRKVALSLAKDHVKGFTIKGRARGRPRKWDYVKLMELYADVRDLENRRGMTRLSACAHLAGQSPRYEGETTKNLYERLAEFKTKEPTWWRWIENLKAEGEPVDDWLIEHLVSYPKNGGE
jgi:hypothetical protein